MRADFSALGEALGGGKECRVSRCRLQLSFGEALAVAAPQAFQSRQLFDLTSPVGRRDEEMVSGPAHAIGATATVAGFDLPTDSSSVRGSDGGRAVQRGMETRPRCGPLDIFKETKERAALNGQQQK